jgi:hypothetical protein
MRLLAAATLALTLLFAPTTSFAHETVPEVETPAPPSASPDFHPSRYLGQGDSFSRADFVSQADAPPEEALSVLAPYPADLMEAFAVSTAVNSPGRDAPEMVEPLPP